MLVDHDFSLLFPPFAPNPSNSQMGFFKWIAFTYCKHTIVLYLFLSVVLSSDLMVVFVYYRHYVWFPGPCYLICVLL